LLGYTNSQAKQHGLDLLPARSVDDEAYRAINMPLQPYDQGPGFFRDREQLDEFSDLQSNKEQTVE